MGRNNLDIIAGKESCYTVGYALVPPIIILLDNIDHCASDKGQLILLVFGIVI